MDRSVIDEISLGDYESYEDYLDAHVSDKDMEYLDRQMARQLVEISCCRGGSHTVLSREAFERHRLDKQGSTEEHSQCEEHGPKAPDTEKSAENDPSKSTLTMALRERETRVRSGNLTPILFLRTSNEKGQEVSGFIDLEERLEDGVKNGHWKLIPRKSDLSYYNWQTGMISSSSSRNFEVIAESEVLKFKSKHDSRIINTHTSEHENGPSIRTEISTQEHLQAVIIDYTPEVS